MTRVTQKRPLRRAADNDAGGPESASDAISGLEARLMHDLQLLTVAFHAAIDEPANANAEGASAH